MRNKQKNKQAKIQMITVTVKLNSFFRFPTERYLCLKVKKYIKMNK